MFTVQSGWYTKEYYLKSCVSNVFWGMSFERLPGGLLPLAARLMRHFPTTRTEKLPLIIAGRVLRPSVVEAVCGENSADPSDFGSGGDSKGAQEV